MRELQIQPLFPPREDVQVGDVYVVAVPNEDTGVCDSRTFLGLSFGSGGRGFVPISAYLGSLDMVTSIQQHYANRLDLPKTQASQLSIGNDGKIVFSGYATPEVSAGLVQSQTASPTAIKRLRIVGFPDFMTVKVSSSDLGMIFPVQAMLMSIGASASAVESASISVPVAESYALPAQDILKGLSGMLVDGAGRCKLTMKEVRALFPSDTLRDHNLQLVGIYEMYYTRAIDSAISLKQEAALGLGRDRSSASQPQAGTGSGGGTQGAGTGQGQGQGSTQQPAGAGSGASQSGSQGSGAGQGNGTSAADSVRADLAKAVASAAEALGKRNGLPGITLDVQSGSAVNIGLRRVFERPVGIGFRAANLSMSEKSDGCIELGQVPLGVAGSGTVVAPASTEFGGKAGK